MFHRRLYSKVSLPVGPLWGKTGVGGVAGCMMWEPDSTTVRNTPHGPMSSYDSQRGKSLDTRLQYDTGYTTRRQHQKVEYESKLDGVYSSRATGSLQMRTPTPHTYQDRDNKYFYTSTVDPYEDIKLTNPLFDEEAAIAAVRGHTSRGDPLSSTAVGDSIMTRRPPRPPSASYRTTSVPTHRGRKVTRKVEFREPRSSSLGRTPTPSARYSTRVNGRSNDEMGLWQDAVDDLLLQKAEDDVLIDSLIRTNSALRSKEPREDYFEKWRETVSPPPGPAPLINTATHRRTYTHSDLDPEHKYLMSKYRRSVKPKVDSHWDKDPLKRSRPVNVNFDCNDDSDMVVNLTVKNNKWRY